MSFYDSLNQYPEKALDEYLANAKPARVKGIIHKDYLSAEDFLALLSPQAEPFLEAMAQKAHKITVSQFGRTIMLYTPMYLSNYCINRCLYCGFNADNTISRKHLNPDEVEQEASRIAETGLKHILILTGESPQKADLSYLKACCAILSRYFTSISIEIYPMDTAPYRELVAAGVDSLTLYQETYNRELYDTLHVKGPKKDFRYRLDGPERGCMARMRRVNIGALLGLDHWRREAFFTGLHAAYLQKHYPDVDISVSLPRIRPHAGTFQPEHPVSDRHLAQIMTALRLFMPRVGITLSTRESARFRDRILPLGVTKMSAGSTTKVGGHTQKKNDTGQFEISDPRSVAQMAEALETLGYQPVYKDWHPIDSAGLSPASLTEAGAASLDSCRVS